MAKDYPKPTQEWLEKTMASLELTREEALEMWCDDHDIDAGLAKDFDLAPERQKVVREMTKGKAAPNYSLEGKTRKPRKEDTEKREIIENLQSAIDDWFSKWEDITEPQIVNPEREITFTLNGNNYSLTLTKHRPPKAAKK